MEKEQLKMSGVLEGQDQLQGMCTNISSLSVIMPQPRREWEGRI